MLVQGMLVSMLNMLHNIMSTLPSHSVDNFKYILKLSNQIAYIRPL